MATPAGRIEKEFLFKVMYDDKLPIIHILDSKEYAFTLEYPAGEELYLRSNRSPVRIKPRTKLSLLFNFRGQAIDFCAEVLSVKENIVICKSPDNLYKNLDRDYLRVGTPSDMKIRFTFKGDRYNLAFPKVMEYEHILSEDMVRNLDTSNLTGLIKQIKILLTKFSDGHRIVNFKDRKPQTIEERIVSETGKALFIPSTTGSLPKADPYPKKRIITEDLFKRYLETTGIGIAFLDENCARFLKNKFDNKIFSDAWVPVLFHEYVIGYINVWIDKQGKLPFDFSVLDHVYQYAKVLAFGLKENGYFEHGKIGNEPFAGKVLDISASGLLFAYPHGSSLLSTLLADSELTVTIEVPNRSINIIVKIVRRFKDKQACYFGCKFTEIAPEDMRFFFEYLYGKQIDEDETKFLLAGQV